MPNNFSIEDSDFKGGFILIIVYFVRGAIWRQVAIIKPTMGVWGW